VQKESETRKKHNPPGILDWIYDWLVKPLAFGMIGAADTIIKAAKELKPDATIKDVQDAIMKPAEPEAPIKPGLSPSEVQALVNSNAWKQVNMADRINQILLLAETASMGWIDITVANLTSRPDYKASQGTAQAVLSSKYDVAISEFLKRHWLKEYTPLLPGYQDMIGVYVREGYIPEKWVELPSKFTEYMKELGYSEDWTKQLWGKHWVLPGVELLYDMFHKKIIDYDLLALMLKFHDFEPEWRDRLIRNAYELIPRVDLRRAYMYGVDGYSDLVEPYEKLGYSPEDAQTMDQIAKRFALEAHYSRLLTVARAAYRKGQLPGPEFQAIMEDIHIPTAAQDLILQAETLARLSSVKDPGEEPYMPSRSDMRWMVEWGLISAEDLKDLAEADGIDPAWSPRVTEAWLLNQQRDELAKVRAVYERRLREGFMSKADFGKALSSLHYAGHVVDALERWADEELDLQESLEEAKEYEALAKDGILTVTEYGQALRKLGMTEERITRSQKHIERLLAIKAAKAEAKAKG